MSAAKRKDANSNGLNKPLKPRLAAPTQARPSPAPKLAGYTPQPNRPSAVHTTPVLPTLKSFTEEKATPVSNFVNANITPRSSSRKSRADSTQSSPAHDSDDTPSRSRPASTLGLENYSHKYGQAALDKLAPDLNRVKAQQTSIQNKHRSLPASPRLALSPEHLNGPLPAADKAGYFFYANQGPSQERGRAQQPQHKKGGSFVYANSINGDVTHHHQPDDQVNVGVISQESKISHASQQPQQQAQAGISANPPNFPLITPSHQTRQTSPQRPGFHLTYRKGASQVIPPSPLSPQKLEFDPTRRRQSSVDDDQENRYSRTFSLSSIGSGDNSAHKEHGFPFLPTFPAPCSKNSSIPSPTADGLQRTPADRDALEALDPDGDHTQSPPSAVGSSGSDPQKTEAAAHARRERKIMDLEISNSSLLVINRSLEKEIRRQKADLRRYKRMSRKSSLEALRLSSGRLSILTEGSEDLQIHGSDEQSEESESQSSESPEEELMSPGAIIERDARHRKQDQRRLQRDLAKHKELLADSQQMNQSLRKCLSVTESLIKEGNRALEYKVTHEDLQLGGRVLTADELNGDLSSSRPPSPFDNTDHLGDPPPIDDPIDALDTSGPAALHILREKF